MTQIELLRDLYIWAYERSTREYLDAHKSLIAPDPLRLRYRQQIHELIAHIVRENIVDSLPYIKSYVENKIRKEDQAGFRELILEDLKRLHEGILARYQLTRDEFQRWQTARQI